MDYHRLHQRDRMRVQGHLSARQPEPDHYLLRLARGQRGRHRRPSSKAALRAQAEAAYREWLARQRRRP